MASFAYGHDDSGSNLSDESASNFEFPDSLESLDGAGGQSPMAWSNFSMSTEERTALHNYDMVLDLLNEQKREKDCQIDQLKREKDELKEKIREAKVKRKEMKQRFALLQAHKQVHYSLQLISFYSLTYLLYSNVILLNFLPNYV